MMRSLSQSNSWHWLTMSIVACLLVGAYLAHVMWKKQSEENGPIIAGMREHGDKLVLLDEADALLIERQVAEIEERLHAYEVAALEKAGPPIPKGEQSVLTLSNEINSTLQKNNLRIVEREQVAERPAATSTSTSAPRPGISPEVRRVTALAAEQEAEQKQESLPYNTREIHYVLEGEYKDMFMFLVKQSHLKPPYHFKNIKITPAPDRAGMRMAFTVEIHFI